MQNRLLHTPEGVRDIYNGECEKKIQLISRMNKEIRKYGYHPIQTPTFEFFDIFSKEVGTIPSRDLYKFFDREGNTLVLRPDITPSIARAAAKYFTDEDIWPIRLCYEGNVFINNHSYQGRLKETTQLGCEMIGENSVAADSEMISLVAEALKASGLSEFQVSISHAGLLRGLMETCAFTGEEEEYLTHLIANKNFFGMEEFLEQKELSKEQRKLFSLLKKIYECPGEWEDMIPCAKECPGVIKALEYLKDLHELLQVYGVDDYVSYEPGMLSNYRYYTGVIFGGYTFGSGEAIVKGGRYDSLLSYFGKEAPAIGFALMADQLLMALERQKIDISETEDGELILYAKSRIKEAIQLAGQRRRQGKVVSLICIGDKEKKERQKEWASSVPVTVLE